MSDEWSRTPKLDEDFLNKEFGYKAQKIPTIGSTVDVDWKIQIIKGFGNIEEENVVPSIWTASHLDLERIQLKAFHRLLMLEHLSRNPNTSRPTFTPIVGLNVLRNLWRTPELQFRIENQANQASEFLHFVFRKSLSPLKIVDEKMELAGQPTRILIDITNFYDVYKELILRFEDEKELKKDSFLKENEKRLLYIYLYNRQKLERELKKYPYPCWILAILSYVKPLYLIADGMNAGLQVLMKYMAYKANRSYYPSTIVLPHPKTISGKNMNYFDSSNRKELRWDETLYIHDTLSEVREKLEQSSWWYLSFIVNNIVAIFAPKIFKKTLHNKDLEGLVRKYGKNRSELLKRIVKAYWEFIKDYYNKVEEICGTKETKRIDASKRSEILRLLGKPNVLKILVTLANLPDGKIAATPSEIASLTGSYRNMANRYLDELEKHELVEVVYHRNTKWYRLPNNFKKLEISLSLTKKVKLNS